MRQRRSASYRAEVSVRRALVLAVAVLLILTACSGRRDEQTTPDDTDEWTRVDVRLDPGSVEPVWLWVAASDDMYKESCGALLDQAIPVGSRGSDKMRVECTPDATSMFRAGFRRDPSGTLYLAYVDLPLLAAADVPERAQVNCNDVADSLVPPDVSPDMGTTTVILCRYDPALADAKLQGGTIAWTVLPESALPLVERFAPCISLLQHLGAPTLDPSLRPVQCQLY